MTSIVDYLILGGPPVVTIVFFIWLRKRSRDIKTVELAGFIAAIAFGLGPAWLRDIREALPRRPDVAEARPRVNATLVIDDVTTNGIAYHIDLLNNGPSVVRDWACVLDSQVSYSSRLEDPMPCISAGGRVRVAETQSVIDLLPTNKTTKVSLHLVYKAKIGNKPVPFRETWRFRVHGDIRQGTALNAEHAQWEQSEIDTVAFRELGDFEGRFAQPEGSFMTWFSPADFKDEPVHTLAACTNKMVLYWPRDNLVEVLMREPGCDARQVVSCDLPDTTKEAHYIALVWSETSTDLYVDHLRVTRTGEAPPIVREDPRMK